jgi:hypothetical protein
LVQSWCVVFLAARQHQLAGTLALVDTRPASAKGPLQRPVAPQRADRDRCGCVVILLITPAPASSVIDCGEFVLVSNFDARDRPRDR